MRILGILSLLLALVVAAIAAFVTTFVVGVRSRNPRVLRFARTFQRDLVNPRVLEEAGRAGSQFSIVRHIGRATGREYETPVEAVPFENGFLIALVYGEQAQWVRNVRAAGSAVIVHDGREHRLDEVRLVPIAETPLAETNRAAIALMGITTALHLSRSA